MTALDLYGVLAAALVLLAFYAVRSVGAYIKASLLILLGLAVATGSAVDASTLLDGIVLVTGLSLCAFGLLFVRVMFIRSVSLSMLRGIDTGSGGVFVEDIGGRLADMRKFRLIRPADADPTLNILTPFGRFVSAVVATLYTLLRVKA